MDPAIRKILKQNYVDSVFHTHVSLIQPRGKFQFNRETSEEFWEKYCELITNNNDKEGDFPLVGIAEKPQTYLPVLVDVDLRIRDDGDLEFESLYTDDQLHSVIEVYQSVLRSIVEGCSDKDLTCVVLEKNMYVQSKNGTSYLKHGFHLHFPYCFLSKVDQEVHVIPRVKDSIKEMNLFQNLGLEDSGEIIDKACCKVPWLLYGSRKNEDAKPYIVTRVYDANREELTLEQAFRKYEIFNHKERKISIRGKVKEYLPRILSILPYGRTTKEVKRGVISPLKEKLKKREKKSSTGHHKMSVDESLKVARRLLPMISQFRVEDRNEWMTIGWILFNISEGVSDGLDLWCDFSARCEEKFDENECIFQWERMTRKDLTLGTLRYYASVDNPVEYNKFKSELCNKYIKASLEGSHNDIAKALYAEYGDEFVCASYTNKIWFQFINHGWEQIEEGIFLRMKISGKISDKYYEAVKDLYDEMRDCEDKARESVLSAKIKSVQKMISNLKSAPFKSNVMKECAEVFYNPHFSKKLDTDPHKVRFMNGVYDLKLNIHRPGRPEDFLSKQMPINYHSFTEDDHEVLDVHTFIEQIFPDKTLRKYFMDNYCEIFTGGNHEKTVPVWTGDGDNGKSIMQMFFDKMLGKLAIKMNTNVITGKKPSAGAAFADLARAGGGVRLVTMEEPDNDEQINVGIVKHLSGGDSFYARDLFERGKDGREIVPLFKMVLICNKLPRVRGADAAFWNRVRVLPFESTFCRDSDPAPETYEEQLKQKRFPRDKNFSKKIPGMVEAFAWVLLEHRKKVKAKIEPDKVRAATDTYRKQNDIYKQFMDESITEDKEKYMSLAELYNIFKEWYRDSLPGHTVPVKNEIEEHFTKIWGTPEAGKKWKGYRMRTLQDDINDGNAIVLTEKDLDRDVDSDDEVVDSDDEKE